MIKVSICCITYNHAPFIRQCLDGFLMQQCNFGFEVLIHDDASTDGTQEIIKEYQKKYPDIIKPIFQIENQYSKGIRGMNLRFNFPRAQGKYIALCEGDDYWTDPLKLQKQVDYMQTHPNTVFLTHAAKKINAVTKEECGEIRPYKNKTICSPENIILSSGNFFPTSSYMFKNQGADFYVNPPNFITISPVGDYALNLYFTLKGEIHYLDEFMSVYRTEVVGSYLYNHKRLNNQAKQKSIEDRIAMLQEFDVYSSKKYTFWVGQKIKQLEFKKYLLIGDSKALLSNDFKNNLKALRPKRRLLIYLKHYLPTIYKLINKENNI